MSFGVVCFDCDSTLSRIEGIDELARKSGQFDQVAALTDAAMNGELPLESVYRARLELIKPTRQAIEDLAQLYIDEVVPGAIETIATLQANGKPVHIVSGGLRQAILPLAEFLGVPAENVHAVDVFFDVEGRFVNFATDSPLSVSGGKAEICRQLVEGYSSVIMIGDGKTDLEAQQSGATVIGFGGVIAREAVRQQADHFVDDGSLTSVLPFLL